MSRANVCWQYLIKSQKEAACNSDIAHVSAELTELRKITLAVAKDFIEQYEWLGNIGSTQYCYGLYLRDRLMSVTCYTRTISPNGFKTLLPEVNSKRIFQLCRGATAPHAPRWAGSRVISLSHRLLRREFDASLVFAYADPRAGELGVIYQAANAIYLGLTDSRGPGEYVINGKRLHPRTVHRKYGTARHEVLLKIDANYERVQRPKKHRYVFILERGRARTHLLHVFHPLVQQPPSRVPSVDLKSRVRRSVRNNGGQNNGGQTTVTA